MATVTHGLKDGIDRILETSNALQRMLEAQKANAVTESRISAIDHALEQIDVLRTDASVARNAIERIRTTAAS